MSSALYHPTPYALKSYVNKWAAHSVRERHHRDGLVVEHHAGGPQEAANSIRRPQPQRPERALDSLRARQRAARRRAEQRPEQLRAHAWVVKARCMLRVEHSCTRVSIPT